MGNIERTTKGEHELIQVLDGCADIEPIPWEELAHSLQQEKLDLRDQLRGAVEALEHLASPNWRARPTGADAQAMAGFAADALARLRQ